MSFEKHIERLKKNREELTNECQTEDEEAILFDKLINEQQSDNPEHYYDEDYIIALLTANTDIDFYTIRDAIHSNIDIFNKVHYSMLNSMFNALDNILDTVGYDRTMSYLLDDEVIEGNFKLKKQLLMICCIQNLCSDVESFIKLFDLDIINVSNCMQTITNMMELTSTLKAYNKGLNFSKKRVGTGSIHQSYDKMLRNHYKIDSKIENISPMYKKVIEYGHNKLKKAKSDDKKAKKSILAYTTIINWLTKNSDSKEIYDIPKELSRIDEDLQLEILKEIYKLNKAYYDSLEKKYNNALKNNKQSISLIFKKFGININEDDIHTDKNEDDIVQALSILQKLKIEDSNIIINIVDNISIDKLESIYSLFQSGAISSEFIINNINTILEKHATFINNINLIRSKNFSNSSIKSIEEVLLEDTNKLEKNLNTLEEYNLLNQKQLAICADILCVDNLDTRIDMVLELGYESLLPDNLRLLEADNLAFKRLIALRRLNIEITDPNQLYSILTTNKFVVKDNDLDNYIYTATIHEEELNDLAKNDFITMLEDFKNTNRTYIFDGIIISKNKVTRNINSINSDILSNTDQIYSIISNSCLDDTEYAKVINCLTAKNKQLKKS